MKSLVIHLADICWHRPETCRLSCAPTPLATDDDILVALLLERDRLNNPQCLNRLAQLTELRLVKCSTWLLGVGTDILDRHLRHVVHYRQLTLHRHDTVGGCEDGVETSSKPSLLFYICCHFCSLALIRSRFKNSLARLR